MVLHNPNNWHWVNKDVSAWTKDFLSQDLIGLRAESNGVNVEISKVLSMDGDVDVSQRKGKVITIFDVRLQLEWTGSIPVKEKQENDDGVEEETEGKKDVSGTITIPEVAHDTEEDEYVFEVEIYSSSLEKELAKDLVRKELTPQLRKHLRKIGPALITEHGKDIQHAPGSNPSSGFTTPRTLQSSSVNSSSASTSAPSTSTTSTTSDRKVNVTSLSDTQEFRTTADQLYQTFTDPQRIAAFTRGAPKLFEGAKVGGKFEIFGGNVSGEYTKLDEPKSIEQKWRLAQWPAGHFSTLSIKFEQNDVDAVTVMRVEWSGVPVGQEEPTKRNWDEYYVRSIKQTFGFGTIL
ncbi:Activator of Hsp90 ATPase-like protein [Zymoseptoria brevis]|uniref:Activator of Hsp90 ATPase-like protein n=1 Tax=Zymoseptoria brevis TaxID=1047168 RepID=A0A0F4GM07_9PEZI|nr:Activator of Hsp90 ATPase-like protein [Zymoseptoria brevis]